MGSLSRLFYVLRDHYIYGDRNSKVCYVKL